MTNELNQMTFCLSVFAVRNFATADFWLMRADEHGWTCVISWGLTQRSWPIWLSETVLSMEMYSNLKSFSVELNFGTIAQKPIERCICFGNFSQFIALRRERSSWVSHYLWQASFRCHPQNKVPSQKNNPVGLAASLERKSLGRIK